MSDDPSEQSGPVPPLGSEGPASSGLSVDHALAALGALPLGVVVQRASGEIVFCNPAAERILGLSRDQMAGRTSLDPRWRAVHEDGSPFPGETHPAMVTLRTGNPLRGVTMGVHAPDGSLRWISIDSEPIRGPGGGPASVVASFADVTERKRSEDRYGSLFREMLNGFALHEIVCDAGGNPVDYRFLAVNPAFERMTGLKADRVVGRTVLEVMPDTEPRWISTYGKVALTGEPIHFEDHAAGLGKHFEVTAYRPAPRQFACIFVDVTERKRSEDELRRSNERFQAVQQIARVGILDVDLSTSDIALSREAMEIYHLDASPTMDLLMDLVHPDDRVRVEESLAAAASGAARHDIEHRMVLPDGSTIYVQAMADLFRRDDGTPARLLGTIQETTRRRQAEEEIRRLNADLEGRVLARTADLTEANRELEAYSYSVSHELRAPLRAIDGFSARIALAYDGLLDDEGRRLFSHVRWNAQRMGQLIDDLLAFSQAGRTNLTFGPVDMTGSAKVAFSHVVPDVASASRISFSVGDLPEAHGDAALLRRVWENLLSNAVKFSTTRERPEIRVEGRVENGEAVYCVRDNGVGFEPKYVGRLFGIFHRLHGTHEFQGTGVGLALVRRIVIRHGGRVWAEGELDRGAAFSFSLPARLGSGL